MSKRPLPFNFNPRLAARKARLHRLKRKGLTPPGDKASQRDLADDANTGRIPRKVTLGGMPDHCLVRCSTKDRCILLGCRLTPP